jgi:hypothetical protein
MPRSEKFLAIVAYTCVLLRQTVPRPQRQTHFPNLCHLWFKSFLFVPVGDAGRKRFRLPRRHRERC